MKMEREIISRENITPSSPTPPQLKIHKLSLLDQIIPSMFVPLVLYFPVSENSPKNADEFINSQTTQNLKRSLSHTLTRFYPLAGRIKDSLSIDCNDEGALFVVSRIIGNLSDFLENPEKAESSLLMPIELKWTEEPAPGTHVLMIQVNYFDCCGIAIGSLFYHKATDGVTISTFLKAWAAISQGNSNQETTSLIPDYIAGSLFPRNETMQRESHLFPLPNQNLKIGKTVMRRYVFDSPAISAIRTKLTAPDHHHQGQGLEFRPSRVEIVSALIWKCFMIVLSANKSSSSTQNHDHPKVVVTHAVNIRRKADPLFPQHSFGNFVWLAPAVSSINKIDHDADLIHTMRNAINTIDSNFVRRMQGEQGFTGYQQNVEETHKEFHDKNAEYLPITSWCNFGLYKFVDFGWGKPVWMSGFNAAPESDEEKPFLNMVWLMDTREGDGIEAWVYLDKHYIAAFDDIQKLWGHASIDPSLF